MKFTRKIILGIFISCLLFNLVSGNIAFGQTETPTLTPTPTPTSTPTPTPDPSSQASSIRDCADNHISVADCPSFLQRKVNDLSSQANTLSSQIAVMDSQIKLTEARIAANQKQISDLTLDIDTTNKKITGLQDTLNNLSQVLLNRVKATYEVGTIEPFQILLSSNDASNFLSRLNYLKIAQGHDRKIIFETTQAKNDYSNQKDILTDKKKQIESLKKQLEAYNSQLDQEKQSKKVLLAQTQGSEATYQSLLSQARAQLAALSSFARSRSGGGLVPHADRSDEWGKYYNQRDSNWGNNKIGGSSETIADVGCLLTSYAMVSSHFGGGATPPDVAGNSSNFWFNTALFLKPGPAANGHNADAVYNPSTDSLKDKLSSNHPVIAGLSYDGGPVADHWVVLRLAEGSTFRINDPLYDGAINVLLTDHYSGLKIVEARIYN